MASHRPSSDFDIYHGSDCVPSIPSSPPEIRSVTKPRKPPSITPRRFTRFFTPKSLRIQNGSSRPSKSRQKLTDITTRAINLQPGRCSDLGPPLEKPGRLDSDPASPGSLRKRKLPITPPESSPLSSPSKRVCRVSPDPSDVYHGTSSRRGSFSDVESEDLPISKPLVRRLVLSSSGARILERSFGGQSGARRPIAPQAVTMAETGHFYSHPEDHFHFGSQMPFCVTAANTLPIVATGDEQGTLRILDAGANTKGLGNLNGLLAHTNALVDVAFSPDDRLIATASADRTAKVSDATRLTPIYHLQGPGSAIKKICFQPGSGEIIAASGRDGSICLYDVRVKPLRPVLGTPGDASNSLEAAGLTAWSGGQRDGGVTQSYWRLFEAGTGHVSAARRSLIDSCPDTRRTALRSKAISVTGLSFLGERRPNLIVSGSESSMCVALWDIRMSSWSSRPLSTTAEPSWHRHRRQYAMTSIVVSEEAGRVYALGKDSTLYAYSTEHLILGHAPELDRNGLPRQLERPGLGPLYGFRHPGLHVGSFFVKAALRRRTPSHAELIAVGNSNGSPIVFPTDPSLLPDRPSTPPPSIPTPTSSFRSASGTDPALGAETIPIYETGVTLGQAHHKEVSDVAWTTEGNLVSASDDLTMRLWRRGSRAQYLRAQPANAAERFNSGWSEDASAHWDDDDEVLE